MLVEGVLTLILDGFGCLVLVREGHGWAALVV